MKKILIIAAIFILTAAITSALLILLPKANVEAAPVVTDTAEPSFSYIIDTPFVTNIKDSDRYAKTSMVLVVDNEDDITLLDEQSYIVKNVIIGILRNTTEDEFLQDDIQDVLSAKIIEALGSTLPIQGLNEVYFTQLVIQ